MFRKEASTFGILVYLLVTQNFPQGIFSAVFQPYYHTVVMQCSWNVILINYYFQVLSRPHRVYRLQLNWSTALADYQNCFDNQDKSKPFFNI